MSVLMPSPWQAMIDKFGLNLVCHFLRSSVPLFQSKLHPSAAVSSEVSLQCERTGLIQDWLTILLQRQNQPRP